MNATLQTGMTVVIIALVFYSLFIRREYKTRQVSSSLLTLLCLGLFFDVTATVFMIFGSLNSPFTLHGFIGYSALAVMFMDTVLLWRVRLRFGKNAAIPVNLHKYSLLAYSWWVVAFITGGLIAMVL
ncbi:MAG: hypothetical protein U0T82_12650 [Bacteroidales bacterium]